MRSVSKIAIRHAYPGRAESETAQRIQLALQRMGITAQEFLDDAAIADFDPDFVLCLSHIEGKTTHYPTYGVIMAPLSWFRDDPKVLRQILSYDGHLTISPSIAAWLNQLVTAIDGCPTFSGFFTSSVQATPASSALPDKVRLAYVGTNWDGQRNATLFRALARRGDVFFHGPPESWGYLDSAARGRQIPFDGHSVLQTYRDMGAGLALDRRDFRPDDIPTNRIFEITAAGAIPLTGDLPFIRHHYGDSVLYLDPEAPPRALEWQITRHLDWIATHSQAAAEMASTSNAIFNRDLALERMLPNILAMHEQASAAPGRGHRLPSCSEPDPILERCAAWVAAMAPPRGQTPPPMTATRDLSDAVPLASRPLAPVVVTVPFTGAEIAIDVFVHTARPCQAGEALASFALRDADGKACGPRQALLPDQSREIGGLRRFRLSITPETHAMAPAAVDIEAGEDFLLVGLVAHLAWDMEVASLDSVGTRGTVWIYGAGEAARDLASRLARLPDRRIVGFIDDFSTGTLFGLPVMPLAAAAAAMRSDACVILASQHWEILWPRLFGLPPRRIFRASPGHGDRLTVLPQALPPKAAGD